MSKSNLWILFFISWWLCPSAYANCNGWLTKWCFEHYNNEHVQLRGQMTDLRGLLAQLPGDIQAKSQARDRMQAEIATLEAQVPIREGAIRELNRNNTGLAKITETSKKYVDNFYSLNQSMKERIPALLVTLHQFLFSQDKALTDRIQEIDREMNDKKTKPRFDALLYEREKLADIQLFISPALVNGTDLPTIKKKLRTDLADKTALAGLNPESQALLREALEAGALSQSVDEQIKNLDRALNESIQSAHQLLSQNQSSVDSQTHSIEDVRRQLTILRASLKDLDDKITQLSQDLHNNVPAQINTKQVRSDFVELYWHCCDNEPHCHFLPDAGSGQNDHSKYENSIDPGRDAPRCKAGGDL